MRPWRNVESDANALVAAWNDPEVSRWTAVPGRTGLADATRWIEGADKRRESGIAIDLVITSVHDDQQVLGEIGLVVVDPARRWVELGYWTAARHRGQGHASTGLELLTDWTLGALEARLCYARTHPDNPASARVAASAGYDHNGDLPDGAEVWVRQRA